MTLPLVEARKNEEVVSISDSQALRFIDEMNGVTDADEAAKALQKQIKFLKKEPNSVQNRHKIKKLYEKLDELQYKPDYLCLIIDSEKDYLRAYQKGFVVNDIRYKRLLGTNGGVKNSTIVFVSERVHDMLCHKIENGRDATKELVPAKFEAYRALVCSGSTPVSLPHGIAVVNDCITKFKSDIIQINDEAEGEPVMEYIPDADIELDESDGYGIMLPSLAQRWSEELGLDYVTSGVNTRFVWEKGMAFTFDFLDFADKIAGTRIIKDAWGNEIDLSNVELILTTSMLKLWDSYNSIDHYLECCLENGYTFSVTKACPEELSAECNLNYQFIQSYELDDEQIEELIRPTIDEIHDILKFDWRKTVLFLRGMGLDENTVMLGDTDFAQAIMINPRVLDDPFVRKKVFSLIKRRIIDAKIGVLKVHGNYSIVCGDPYALCQSMFGLQVTGLLSAGEIYNGYWAEHGAQELACFRAPMTCHNNIRKVEVHRSDAAAYWYQHMPACTLFNAWDTAAHALNGMDKDGDLVMTTDNPVLVKNLKQLPALMCVQRKAQKKVITEDDLVRANIGSFGNDIGKITNRITSMFEILAGLEPGSREYEMLEYRIKCGQNFQQNSIDRAKGIIAKPMPKSWYDRHAANLIADPDTAELYARIVADRKPYFMRYIYPDLMRKYNTYIKNTNKKALREFRLTVDELKAKDLADLSYEESEFLRYYELQMPVGTNDCVMNKICRRFEQEFDGYIVKHSGDEFDYSILRGDHEYSQTQYYDMMRIYNEHKARVQDFIQYTKEERLDDDESLVRRTLLIQAYKRDCLAVCSNAQQMCDILLDICYRREGSKQLVWDVASAEIIENLLEKNDRVIRFPTKSAVGDITFNGVRFDVHEKRLEESL